MALALTEPVRLAGPRASTQAAASTTNAIANSKAIADSQRSKQSVVDARPAAGPVLRSGLRNIDREFNRQVNGCQQALAFLEQAGSRLRTLQVALKDSKAAAPAVENQIQAFDALLRNRSVATGGTLDNRLEFHPAGDAPQRFNIRGLQRSALQAGDRETLSFAVDGRTQRAATVVVEPGLSDAALVQRFDRALSSLGIRVERDPQGELSFSVPESAWAGVRNTLSIKGEGRRFPTGQFSQLKLTPEPPSIRPQEWSTDDSRTTLRQVFNAQASVRQSYQQVSDALREAGDRLQQQSDLAQTVDPSRNAVLSQSFESAVGSNDPQSISAILPALLGLDRNRVLSVLRLT
jgi:hypothetical protein